MRFVATIKIPHSKANQQISQGTFAETVQGVLQGMHPEAVYLGFVDGTRGGWAVLNIDDASQIPGLFEPLFLALDAEVSVSPVMTPEDLQKGFPGLQAAAQKYGGS